jgi:hypothetical protein
MKRQGLTWAGCVSLVLVPLMAKADPAGWVTGSTPSRADSATPSWTTQAVGLDPGPIIEADQSHPLFPNPAIEAHRHADRSPGKSKATPHQKAVLPESGTQLVDRMFQAERRPPDERIWRA